MLSKGKGKDSKGRANNNFYRKLYEKKSSQKCENCKKKAVTQKMIVGLRESYNATIVKKLSICKKIAYS